MKILIVIIFSLFTMSAMTACETFNTARTTAKPTNAKESVIYAYAQLGSIRFAAATIGSDPALLDDKAATGLMIYITDKLMAPVLKNASDILLEYRAGKITMLKAITKLRPDINTDGLAMVASMPGAHPDIVKLHKITAQIVGQIDLIRNVADLENCVITIGKIAMPCTSTADRFVAAFIAYRLARPK